MIAPARFRRGGLVGCIAICALLAVIYPATNSQPQNIPRQIVTWNAYLPLNKAGTGEFSTANLSASVQGKSPSVPLFQRAMQTPPQLSDSVRSLDVDKTQSTCVELLSGTGAQRSVPIDLGGAMRLSFRHSIYGSQVEELFALRRDGFQLTQLRYSEARLVDYYGYENAKLENSTWIVTPKPALLPYLRLNMSSDAFMSLRFDPHANGKPRSIRPTGALRLTVAYCKSSAHD